VTQQAAERTRDGREERLDEAVAAYLRAAEAGAEPDAQDWLARHPDLAPDLERFLAARARVECLAAPLRTVADAVAPPPQTLGDFRIVREVGRGGMGVVYEAEQISLGRRVALKVLPFAATMDPRHLQRFHNEARAAAGLHHPHIVPVHGVGCERGVHYYAMQFINGQTLAEFLARQRGNAGTPVDVPTVDEGAAAPSSTTLSPAAQATSPAPRDASYCRRVAEMLVQAAEALEHAHHLGVVHRDIKPGNLMLDAQGKLWVTDFGLARFGTDAGLTMTGDLLGTLRYMSPEQALARHGLVDHRTDVYSLGATLYELLTLRPAIDGQDRQEILRRIAFDEPPAPRSLNKAIPADLETVVLRALAKEPAERYATAQELADDLRRWLEHKPLRARRPGLLERGRKWCRRHQAVVTAAGLGLAVAALALAASTVWALAKQGETAVAYDQAEAQRLEAEKSAEAARQAATQADRQRQRAEKHLDLLAQFGKGGEAVTAWERIVAERPQKAVYRLELWRAYQDRGNTLARKHKFKDAAQAERQAIAALQKLLADFPNDAMAIPGPSFLAGSHAAVAFRSRRAGLFREAEEAYQTALTRYHELRLNRIQKHQKLAELYAGLGEACLGSGNFPAAEPAFTRALAEVQAMAGDDPFQPPGVRWRISAQVHLGLGKLFQARREPLQAEDAFRQALGYYEKYAQAYPPQAWIRKLDLAWFWTTCPEVKLRDLPRAIAIAREVVDEALARVDADALARAEKALGLAYFRAGDWKNARQSLLHLYATTKEDAECDNSIILLQAMAVWHLRDDKQFRGRITPRVLALGMYNQVANRMDQGQVQDVELSPYRAEAAALLGVKDRGPDLKSEAPQKDKK
jgi:serine/threonine protein kinase